MSLVQPRFVGTPTREWSCYGKRGYSNLFVALTEAHFIVKSHGDSMWPYKCFYCPRYHLGHLPKQVQILIGGMVGGRAEFSP